MAVVVTPLQRQESLESVAAALNDHLKGVPGTVLQAKIRLGIAKCAQQAVWCEGCNGLVVPAGTCLRPDGVKFAKLCADLDHHGGPASKSYDSCLSCSQSADEVTVFPFEHCKLESSQVSLLTSIVHAIVRHQGRLDKQWYADTIQALKASQIVPQVRKEDDPDAILAINAAFCEITYLAAMTHGIHMVFLLLDKNMPALPSFEEIPASLEPLGIHFPSLLLKQRQVQQNDKVAFAPYFLAKDIDTKSAEFQKLPPEYGTLLLEETQMNMGPWVASVFAITDLFLFRTKIAATWYPCSAMVRRLLAWLVW
jgi:hypothetical protein